MASEAELRKRNTPKSTKADLKSDEKEQKPKAKANVRVPHAPFITIHAPETYVRLP